MSDVYESIMTGLSEAVEDARSEKKKLKRRVVTVTPVKQYQPDEVKKSEIPLGCLKKYLQVIWGFRIRRLKHGSLEQIIRPVRPVGFLI